MRILVLNGSSRPKGNTKQMVDAFRKGAESVGNQVDVVDVCKKKIAGCLACEYCHTKGNGVCVQKDDMQEVYSAAYPRKPRNLKKVAMILSSGDPEMYDGAMFSYKGDFLEYLGLEDMGVFTAYGMENGSVSKLKELRDFGKTLR